MTPDRLRQLAAQAAPFIKWTTSHGVIVDHSTPLEQGVVLGPDAAVLLADAIDALELLRQWAETEGMEGKGPLIPAGADTVDRLLARFASLGEHT